MAGAYQFSTMPGFQRQFLYNNRWLDPRYNNQMNPAYTGQLFNETVQQGMNMPPTVAGVGGSTVAPVVTPPTTSGGSIPTWAKVAGIGGVALGQGLKLLNPAPKINYTVPTSVPALNKMRKNLGQTNQAMLGQELNTVRQNATRAGLSSSPGFISSLSNPAYQHAGQRQVQGEAAISEAEMAAWLQLENMKMKKAILEEQMEGSGGVGDIISGAAQMLPLMFL